MKDPYGSAFYRLYRKFLSTSIRFRWITVGVVVGLFVMAMVGFGHVKNLFFPNSTTPMYYIDFWFPEGTHIDETSRLMKEAEAYLSKQEGTRDVVTFIGGGQIRFLLTYTPEPPYGSFAQVIVKMDDYRKIPALMQRAQNDLETMLPQAIVNTRSFILGPGSGGKLQLRINGPDPVVLRQLAEKAENILLDDPFCKAVRNEWRSKIKVVRPHLAEAQARRAGIDRPQLAQAIESAIEGTRAGVYREKDELLPIIARSPKAERVDLANLQGIQVWSPAAQKMMPISKYGLIQVL